MKTAIIGAGPAGLAALKTISQSPTEIFLFDAGKSHEERDHAVASDLGVGIGGAGLFSDGKFSFYPSGTQVYKLKNQRIISDGHEWLCDELTKVGIESFPLCFNNQTILSDPFLVKNYPSSYGGLEQRKQLIANLVQTQQTTFLYNSNVKKISKEYNQYRVHFTNKNSATDETLLVDSIILATGRLGNLAISSLISDFIVKQESLRYEVGIRIETPSSIGFLSRKNNPDVKIIWKESFGEIRTFCTCRNGEVWNIPYEHLSAISGRSDGPKTDYSNFGLLLRFTGDYFNLGEKYFTDIIQSDLIKNGEVAWQSLPDFLQLNQYLNNNTDTQFSRPWFPKNKFKQASIANLIGGDMHKMFCKAIEKLLDWSPDLLSEDTMVLFPAIEGTGIYPLLTNELQIEGENIWCCGDLAGKFRGIIPAFLSGYYAARCLLR